jgi:methyl-accepting chemotaxis protein
MAPSDVRAGMRVPERLTNMDAVEAAFFRIEQKIEESALGLRGIGVRVAALEIGNKCSIDRETRCFQRIEKLESEQLEASKITTVVTELKTCMEKQGERIEQLATAIVEQGNTTNRILLATQQAMTEAISIFQRQGARIERKASKIKDDTEQRADAIEKQTKELASKVTVPGNTIKAVLWLVAAVAGLISVAIGTVLSPVFHDWLFKILRGQ